MKPESVTSIILSLYLLIITIILLGVTTQNVVLIGIPLGIIIIGILFHHQWISLAGLFGYYGALTALLLITTIDQLFASFFIIFAILIPSMILLSSLLQLHRQQPQLFSIHKKALLAYIILQLVIISFVFLLSQHLWGGVLLSEDLLHGQLMLLAALTLVCTTPIFLWTKKKLSAKAS